MLKKILIPTLVLGLSAAFAEATKTETTKTETVTTTTTVEKVVVEKKTTAKKIDLTNGKKVYETNCLLCHGATGKGDGAGAAALNPKPRNFTDTARMIAEGPEKLRKVIAKGGASAGLSPLMPAWKGILKDNQIDDVLGYVLKTFSGEGTPRYEALVKAAAEKPKK